MPHMCRLAPRAARRTTRTPANARVTTHRHYAVGGARRTRSTRDLGECMKEMVTATRRRLALVAAAAVVHLMTLGAPPIDAQAARQSTISGRVTDAVSGAPVEAAQVRVLGTTLGAVADAEGRYTIRGVPAGAVEVRALRVGYA